MKTINRAVKRNNVTIPNTFGLRPRAVRPTVLAALESTGNFTVSEGIIILHCELLLFG
jgi:hypothetical protein